MSIKLCRYLVSLLVFRVGLVCVYRNHDGLIHLDAGNGTSFSTHRLLLQSRVVLCGKFPSNLLAEYLELVSFLEFS